jgi:hypothetical protein
MAEPQTRPETPVAAEDSRATIRKSQGWVTLYKGSTVRNHEVENLGGSDPDGSPYELEVEADGESLGSIGKGQTSESEAKKLRIRALCDMISYEYSNW